MKILSILLALPIFLFAANIEISQVSQNEISLHWLDDGSLEIAESEFGDFVEIRMAGASYIWDVGKPHIPVFRIAVRVGENAVIAAETGNSFTEIPIDAQVLPSQPMAAQRWQTITELDTAMYSSDMPFPQETARIIQSGVLHGDRFIVVEICPVRYYPRSDIIEIVDEITVAINSQPYQKSSPSRVFDIIKSIFFANFLLDPENRAPAKMLVICPAHYQLPIEPWLNWRKAAGYSIIVQTPDELGGTYSGIKRAIDSLYSAWDGIDYLILVGDVEDVPTNDYGGSESPTDIDYGCVDGDDYVPDILIGRISVENTEQLIELVGRFIEYEQFAFADSAFAGRYLFGTSDDSYFHDMVHVVHEYVRSNFLDSLGIGYEELDGFEASEADVIAALDSGYAYYYYYGHGWSGGLSAPPLEFAGVDELANAGMYPFIVGNACSTNDFTNPTSFGEALLRRYNAGAIAYIGGSNSTYWYPDSVWEIETFRHFLVDSIASAMGQCYAALLDVMVEFPSYGHYFFDVYNLIGDPAIQLWAGIPEQLDITAPSAYTFGAATNLDIDVSASGEPVVNATVCILRSDTSFIGITDEFGHIEFEIPPLLPETLLVTATAFRCIPAQTAIAPLSPDEPFIYLSRYNPCDTESISTRNDNDGEWDFGETLAVEIELINMAVAAHDIELHVACEDSFLTLWNTDTSFASLDSGEILVYSFFANVHTTIPDNYTAQLSIEISDGDGHSWEYSRQLLLHSPVVEFGAVSISDTAFGDGDFIIESGETVIVWLDIAALSGCDLHYMQLDAAIPDSVDFANLLSGDTMLVGILPPFTAKLPFTVAITGEMPSGLPIIFDWSVYERSESDTFFVFAGSPGFQSDAEDFVFWTSAASGPWSLLEDTYNSPGKCFVNRTDDRHFYDAAEMWVLVSNPFVVPWNANLAFWYRLYIPSALANEDTAWVELWTEEDTITLIALNKPQTLWELILTKIPADYFGKSGQIAFRFISDENNTRAGFLIDDISVLPAGSFLGDASATPEIAENHDLFTFGITYSSVDNELPVSVSAFIDDEEVHLMPDVMYDTEWRRFFNNRHLIAGVHRYYYIVEDSRGIHRFPQEGEFAGPMVGEAVYESDFEFDNGGLSVVSDGWYWSDIGYAHSGAFCWNNIGAGEFYAPELDARLVCHLNLIGLGCPAITFWSSMYFARGSTSGLIRDGCNIKVRTASATEVIYPIPMYDGDIVSSANPLAGEPAWGETWSEGWHNVYIDLQDWAGQEIDIIFNTGTNDIEETWGWFIDDLKLIDIGSEHIATAVPSIPEIFKISVSPNPFNSTIRFQVSGNKEQISSIEIFDLNGKLVYAHDVAASHSNKSASLAEQSPENALLSQIGEYTFIWQPDESIGSGIYLIRAKMGKSNTRSKMILYLK